MGKIKCFYCLDCPPPGEEPWEASEPWERGFLSLRFIFMWIGVLPAWVPGSRAPPTVVGSEVCVWSLQARYKPVLPPTPPS